jgi:drug/metabolite transporter (DMT)-like permease
VIAAIQLGWDELSDNVKGACLVMLSGLLFSTVSLLVKLLGHDLHVLQIAFFRALFGLLWVLPFAAAQGVGVLRTTRPIGHLLRGAFGMGAMFCSFYAAIHLPLADATALTFTKPFFVVLFAVMFLGETLRSERLVAIVIGFAGMLILLRPDLHTDLAAFVALFGAVFMALVVIMLAKLGRSEPSVTVMLYFGLISTAIAFGPMLFVWQWPTWPQFLLLIAIGACGAAAQTAMLRGFAIGETTVLVNFEYLQLMHAALFGLIFFGDIPTSWTVIGSLVIVGSAAYVAHSEAAKTRRAKLAAISPEAEAAAIGRFRLPALRKYGNDS